MFLLIASFLLIIFSSYCLSAVKDFLRECTRSIVGDCSQMKQAVRLMIYNTVNIYIHQYVPELIQNNMAAICGDTYFDPEQIRETFSYKYCSFVWPSSESSTLIRILEKQINTLRTNNLLF